MLQASLRNLASLHRVRGLLKYFILGVPWGQQKERERERERARERERERERDTNAGRAAEGYCCGCD